MAASFLPLLYVLYGIELHMGCHSRCVVLLLRNGLSEAVQRAGRRVNVTGCPSRLFR